MAEPPPSHCGYLYTCCISGMRPNCELFKNHTSPMATGNVPPASQQYWGELHVVLQFGEGSGWPIKAGGQNTEDRE